MTRTIFCKKLAMEEIGLDYTPVPGELGQTIYNEISKRAWQMWVGHQTMLINEYRLNMLDQEAKDFLMAEMKKFLLGEGSALPAGYTPTE